MANNNENVSVTDQMFTSEVGVCSTPISWIESSATKSLGLDRVQETPTSTRSENKRDEMLTRLYNMMCSNFN